MASRAKPLSSAARRLLGDFSLEVTAGTAAGLAASTATQPAGTPVSITYLPGETFRARVEAARLIRSLGYLPIPHISARRLASVQELDDYLAALADQAGLDRVLVVAGDCHALGPFNDALAVIETGRLAAHGVRRVGISGYPEGHPDIPVERLNRSLHDKYRRLLDMGHDPVVTTQFAFDGQRMLDWVETVRAMGVDCTIRLGVPGPATVGALLRFAARCGVGASTKVLRKYGVSITRLMNVAGPDRLLEDLADGMDAAHHGDVRLHLYPFGGMDRMTGWLADCAA